MGDCWGGVETRQEGKGGGLEWSRGTVFLVAVWVGGEDNGSEVWACFPHNIEREVPPPGTL